MNIIIAKTAGFCMGVRRAVEMVLDASNKSEDPICTYGPLIHNPQVLGLLEEKGICAINEIPDKGHGTILIRAHGVPPDAKKCLEEAGFSVKDATCPRVIKVQTIIKKHSEKGYAVIIIGDNDHPEVIGLLGFAGENGYIVDNIEKLESLPKFEKAIIVAQTTQNTLFFEEVKKWVIENRPEYKIFNTICDSTAKRQAEIISIAESADTLIVVGGKNSGNTQRLAEMAGNTGKPTFHIENASELSEEAISNARSIGITAGASTPNWVMKKVYQKLETFPAKRKLNWRKLLFAIQQPLLLTNIYVAIGAGSLSYACSRLQGINYNFSHILIAMLYILSMHTINNITAGKSHHYNDPERADFYSRNGLFLVAMAIVAGIASLITSYSLGKIPFLIFLTMYVLGLLYNMKLFPKGFFKFRYQSLNEIPGSKTILVAVAWGVVTTVFPAFSESGQINYLSTALVFIWATGIVFVRTAFFDILDMQGDRIVGKETIPIFLGEKTTKLLLKIILSILLIIMISASALNLVSSLGFALGLYPVFMFIVFSAYEKGYVHHGFMLELLIETHLVLAGVITLIWSASWP
ncbi:MAG: 4-hydroxy-3-methylbut-2-enyl diphosphate reductase [Desulfobacterales bacterium]|nr:4-hydroxy-3-methylbut-2-enyl diphosphate reductase [Desulfobacterales bacterium]